MNSNLLGVGRLLTFLAFAASSYCNAQVPQISSFTPDLGSNGTAITITGTNFSSVASNNVVAFGSVHAGVVSASPTQLTVLVPPDAVYAPISVTVNGLIGYSAAPFRLTSPVSGSFDETSLLDQTPLTGINLPGGVVMVDFDGDGKLDLLVADYGPGTVSIYRNISSNNGDITFAPPVILPVGVNPYFLTAGDIDGDGKPDIAVGNAGSSFATIYHNECTPGNITAQSFGPRLDVPVPSPISSACIGDLNLDGKPDLIIPCVSYVMVFRNIGKAGSITSETFAPPVSFDVGQAPWRVAVGDIDGDGMPDMAVDNDSSGTISILRNTGKKGDDVISFAPKVDFDVGARPLCVVLGDLDMDGKPDLVASTYGSQTVCVFKNLSTPGSFTTASLGPRIDYNVGANVHTVVIGDINADGKPDLLAVGEYFNNLSVFLNKGQTNGLSSDSFAPAILFPVKANPISIGVGDLNGDGVPDVVVADTFDATISVFKNIMGPSAPRITADLQDVSTFGGSSVTLSITAKGSAPLSYQWFFNGTNLLNGAAGPSLVLTNIQPAQAGSYSVVVSNSLGSITSSNAVVSFVPFAWVTQPTSRKAAAGQAVSFSVSVIGPGPWTYQWLWNGTNIPGANGASLTFNPVQTNNAGTYQALVSCQYGSALSASATLTVLPGAPFITSVAPAAAPVGSVVTITGANFDPVATNNVVRFGAVQASVLTATSTQLTVLVPSGASCAPIAVTAGTLTAVAPKAFIPTFISGQSLASTSFAPQQVVRAGSGPYSTIIADLDGDGRPDLIVANIGSSLSIYRNIGTNGTVQFADPVNFFAESGNYHVEVADFDGDGRLDIAVSAKSGSFISIFRNIGSPGSINPDTFSAPVRYSTGSSPMQFTVADIDGDGKLDLVSANSLTETVSVLRNTSTVGKVMFAQKVDYTVGLHPAWVAAGDIDGDGKPDLAVVGASSRTLMLLRNKATSGSISSNSFASPVGFLLAVGSQPNAVALGDLDGDGKLDVVVGLSGAHQLAVFRNQSVPGTLAYNSLAPQFYLALPGAAHQIALADLDGDGKLDILATSQALPKVSVFKFLGGVLGANSFASRVDFTAGIYPEGIVASDLNGDGKPDLVVANGSDNTFSVLLNTVALPSPTITAQPFNCIAPMGGTVSDYVTVSGLAPISYQWFFNGTNLLAGQTNAALLLTNVQATDVGGYFVVVTNVYGSVTSSVANLDVRVTPVITSQPKSQKVSSGADVTFGVEVTGSPLTYQWFGNGSILWSQTNSTLVVSNVQPWQAGTYFVAIYNGAQTINSSNAVLTVQQAPVIVTQPANQQVTSGSNVTFTVGNGGTLPAVGSGNLLLWLKADAGVTTDSQGHVTRWQDQAGTNDAFQTNPAQQPVLARSDAIFGRPVIRFDGLVSATQGDYLQGFGKLDVSHAYTSFIIYNSTANDSQRVLVLAGQILAYNHVRGKYFYSGQMCFTGWADDTGAGFWPPLNTVRLWTDRMNTNCSVLDMYDYTAASTNEFPGFNVSGLGDVADGYYVGGLGSETRNFGGDIAEIIYYRGALTEADRYSVQDYLQRKYFQNIEGSSVTYQWQFNGTNIDGATNASLTITNAQASDAGNYTVILSNGDGSVTSSNAVLTINLPPSITTQPQSQAVIAGQNLTLTAAVAGTGPLSYQWLFNGSAINGETNLSLAINNVQPASAGSYQIAVASPYGSALSSNAIVSIASASLQVMGGSGVGGGTVTVPIQLVTLGDENAVGFSLGYDPTVLTVTDVSLGRGVTGATLMTNSFGLGGGKLGVSLALPAEATFGAGTQDVVLVTFAIAPLTVGQVTPISFVGDPIPEAVVDVTAKNLSFTTLNGSVAVVQADYEGDVTAKSSGSHTVAIADWVKVGRFVAGLDTPANPGEFQRADCAPRNTLGNGKLTITDWVQAGRYAARLDALTPAGGPTVPTSSLRASAPQNGGPVARTLSIRALKPSGATNSVYIELADMGSENAVGFSLNFDTNVLKYLSFGAGSIANVPVNVNTNYASNGHVGVAITASPGALLPIGTQQLIRIDFVALSYIPNSVKLTFGNFPVSTELSDISALAVSMNPVDLTLSAVGLPLPSITVTDLKTNVMVSWPSWASAFLLESTGDLHTNWSAVNQSPVVNGDTTAVTIPPPPKAQFFRLKLQQ